MLPAFVSCALKNGLGEGVGVILFRMGNLLAGRNRFSRGTR